MNQPRKSVLARITGRVQRVSFRAWTRREATRLGLAGWVRNEADGSVSALLDGPETAVDAMVRLLWQGPPASRVTHVAVENSPPGEIRGRFEIRDRNGSG
ncbi:MAG: acylphosphatase [Oricola sp.]